MSVSGSQPEIYTIFCIITGDTTPFSVDIESNETVGIFKNKIKERKPKSLASIEADELKLYQIDLPDDDNLAKNVTQSFSNTESPLVALRVTKQLAGVFKDGLKAETVHIIVQIPQTNSTIVARGKKRKYDDLAVNEEQGNIKNPPISGLQRDPPPAKKDIRSQLLKKWRSQPTSTLNLPSLRAYLQQPLAEDEKIPISQDLFDSLLLPFGPEVDLTAEELATLFRISMEECALRVERPFVSVIDSGRPSSGNDTKDLFHSFWDDNISKILKLILWEAKPIRNSNHNSSIALKRPDYGLLVKNFCVLRGEERVSDTAADPKQELVDKLIWSYSPLPYVLGYQANTTSVHFAAITHPPSRIESLFYHDLEYKKERLANLIHIIRLSGVVRQLGEQLGYRDMPEFVDFEREGGLVRMSIAGVVKKEFRHPDAAARVSHLVEIYNLLKSKHVPNVDTLDRAKTHGIHPYVHLSPVGQDTLPKSGSEAFNAVVCVLEALKVMHSTPNPMYHRDVRQPNILRRLDGQGWFLIDWSDASMAPTRAVTHLKESEHSPRVREENHGAEVDMWGLGQYLEDLASRGSCGIANPEAVKEMARKWMSDATMSAAAALDEINANQHLFTGSAAQTS